MDKFSKGEINSTQIPKQHIINNSIPLVVHMRELFPDSKAENLFDQQDSESSTKLAVNKSEKFPYFKTKIEIRPVHDQSVHTAESLGNGPFRYIKQHPELALYEPYLYTSDFWLMEKDYKALNKSLIGQPLELSVSYSSISIFSWSMQSQMIDQWTTASSSEWSLTDTQRDSFMIKRLVLDTNFYVLGSSH